VELNIALLIRRSCYDVRGSRPREDNVVLTDASRFTSGILKTRCVNTSSTADTTQSVVRAASNVKRATRHIACSRVSVDRLCAAEWDQLWLNFCWMTRRTLLKCSEVRVTSEVLLPNFHRPPLHASAWGAGSKATIRLHLTCMGSGTAGSLTLTASGFAPRRPKSSSTVDGCTRRRVWLCAYFTLGQHRQEVGLFERTYPEWFDIGTSQIFARL